MNNTCTRKGLSTHSHVHLGAAGGRVQHNFTKAAHLLVYVCGSCGEMSHQLININH